MNTNYSSNDELLYESFTTLCDLNDDPDNDKASDDIVGVCYGDTDGVLLTLRDGRQLLIRCTEA